MAATASFQAFLEWLEVQQEHLLDELVTAREECECGVMQEKDRRELIVRVLTQYESFYEEKSRAAHRNVFLMFYPPWCSSLECAFLWLSGFRPTSLFCLASAAVPDLSPDQLLCLERLKTEIRMEEKVLLQPGKQERLLGERELQEVYSVPVLLLDNQAWPFSPVTIWFCDEQAKIQENISSPDIVTAMKRIGWRAHGVGEAGHDADVAMQPIRAAMEALVASADTLRARAATKVVGLLSSAQSIRFLIAATQFEKYMRIKGKERDAVLAGRFNGTIS